MSHGTETTRPDALLDAYRQASAHEGARAGSNVRAAVLAHARVVAQASGAAAAAPDMGVAQATRATPAANDSQPIWRLAAGVVIGLVGVWIFQLTRPSAAPDTAVAVATAPSAPQANKAGAAEPAVAASPAAPPAAATPEATVAAATPVATKDRAAKPVSAARARGAEAPVTEQNLAMAKVPAPIEKTDRPTVFTGVAATAPAAVTAASAADALAGAMGNEVIIASAEIRKSVKAESRAQPPSAVLAMPASPPGAAPASAAPNAFPAPASEVIVAAAPVPRPAPAALAAPATVAAPLRAGASGATAARSAAAPADAARVTLLSDADLAMFLAVRAGDIPALRIAIARGVNVNAKDERGRTALQIARERVDSETIKVLEAAGAR